MKSKLVLFLLIISSVLIAEEWVVKHNNTAYNLTSVHFSDKDNGVAVGGNRVLQTTDGGETWMELDTTTTIWFKVTGPPKSNTLFLCGINGQIGKLQNGTITELVSGTAKVLNGIAFASETTGYAVGQDGIFLKTTNGGANWSALSSGTSEWLSNVKIGADTNALIIVGDHGTIKQSNDGGDSLITVSIPGNNSYLGSAAFISQDYFWVCGSEGTLVKFTPQGSTVINTGSTDGIMGLTFPTPDFGVGVGDNGNILEYNGTDWVKQTSPVTDWLNDITSNSDTGKGNATFHLWAVGENGTILKKTVTLVNVDENILPINYNVSNNYPNPFNPTTKFNFSIPSLSQVIIDLYNSLGEKISNVKNEVMDVGNYDININANNLTSGIYFVKFNFKPETTSNEFSIMKKIMLIK